MEKHTEVLELVRYSNQLGQEICGLVDRTPNAGKRSGGTAVYSTCSVEPEENEQVVESVVEAAGRGLCVVRQELTLPDPPHRDGGFTAVLQVADPIAS